MWSAWRSSCAITWARTTSCSPPISRTSSATGPTRARSRAPLRRCSRRRAFRIAAGTCWSSSTSSRRLSAGKWGRRQEGAPLRPQPVRRALGRRLRRRRAAGRELGWDAALQPDSQLRRRDTYVLLAAAFEPPARRARPAPRQSRQPPPDGHRVVDRHHRRARSRPHAARGVGDTAVRLAGLRPARVKELEAGTRLMRARRRGGRGRRGPPGAPAAPPAGADLDRRRRSAHAADGRGVADGASSAPGRTRRISAWPWRRSGRGRSRTRSGGDPRGGNLPHGARG
jgi:hypothetical protein